MSARLPMLPVHKLLGHPLQVEALIDCTDNLSLVKSYGKHSPRLHASHFMDHARSHRQPSPRLCSQRLEWTPVAALQHGLAAPWTTLIRTGAPASGAAAAPATGASGRPQPTPRTAVPSSTSARLGSECPARPGVSLGNLPRSHGWWLACPTPCRGRAGR